MQTLADFWPLAGFLFDGPADDPKAREKVLGREGALGRLGTPRAAIAAVEPWTVEGVEAALRTARRARGRQAEATSSSPIRVAIAGTTVSPGIWESVALLGRDEALRAHRRGLQSRSTNVLKADGLSLPISPVSERHRHPAPRPHRATERRRQPSASTTRGTAAG